MRVLSIDPSFTVTGWALFDSHELVDFNKWKTVGGKTERATDERLDLIQQAAFHLITDFNPDIALVEMTSGKVNTGRHGGGGSGLSKYGMAIGVIWATCSTLIPGSDGVVSIEENTWTRRIPKKDRQMAIAVQYPQYDMTEDKGGDIADAIGMYDWWRQEQLVRSACRDHGE